jgi:hypothetical protein
MRLHIHHQVGSGDGLCHLHYEVEEPISVTQRNVADAWLTIDHGGHLSAQLPARKG